MEAKKLYARLDADFIKPGMSDDWMRHMDKVVDFISENFKKRSMGLVCDNSDEINSVYSAVFPTDEVMRIVLEKGKRNALLFVHHPSIWDLSIGGDPWQQMNLDLLEQFKQNKISIYNLHVPLDNYGSYSTSSNLAKALGIKFEKAFAPYGGGLAGVIGNTKCKDVEELRKAFAKAVGHEVSLYPYGDAKIKGGRVAVVAGGGNGMDTLPYTVQEGVNTLVTGLSLLNDYSRKAHEYDKEHGLNVLGGTHYSTERFACMEMCKCFEKLGLPCKFIEGKPGMKDL